jgi:hypothetical protein
MQGFAPLHFSLCSLWNASIPRSPNEKCPQGGIDSNWRRGRDCNLPLSLEKSNRLKINHKKPHKALNISILSSKITTRKNKNTTRKMNTNNESVD